MTQMKKCTEWQNLQIKVNEEERNKGTDTWHALKIYCLSYKIFTVIKY